MKTYKSKTKHGGEVIIHTHCSLKELYEQIPSTEAFKERIVREQKESMRRKNDEI